MISGLRPIHSVETITWTSEMSGTASSGVAVIAQMPHRVSTTVPVKTRKRLPVHQSIVRAIMAWLFCAPQRYALLRGHRQLLAADLLAVLHRHDRDVPRAGHQDLALALVHALAH